MKVVADKNNISLVGADIEGVRVALLCKNIELPSMKT